LSAWWPDIHDTKSAKQAVWGATGAALFVSAMTLLSVALGWRPQSSLLDAIIFAVIAWRIYKMSKAWAIVGWVLYAIELGSNLYVFGLKFGTLITGAFLLAAFLAGIRGTFAYSKLSAMQTTYLAGTP
jgi:hypothetical protein